MGYEVLIGDCIESMKKLPDESVDMCVTSPPYYALRNYNNNPKQIGLEPTLGQYIENMVAVFTEVHRILKPHGTLWLNLGDSYNGSGGAGGDYNPGGIKEGQPKYTGRNEPNLKRKDLMGVPWRVAFALQDAGWWLRQDIIWAKPNCMPEAVKDRCTKAHEYIFLFSKSKSYFFDHEAIRTPTSNKRSVWDVSPKPYPEAHFAVYPPELIEPCVLAGCPVGGTVLDPFGGSGTTAGVAIKYGRKAILCELNEEYAVLIPARIKAIAEIAVSLDDEREWL